MKNLILLCLTILSLDVAHAKERSFGDVEVSIPKEWKLEKVGRSTLWNRITYKLELNSDTVVFLHHSGPGIKRKRPLFRRHIIRPPWIEICEEGKIEIGGVFFDLLKYREHGVGDCRYRISWSGIEHTLTLEGEGHLSDTILNLASDMNKISNKATHTTSANARLFQNEPSKINDLRHGGQA